VTRCRRSIPIIAALLIAPCLSAQELPDAPYTWLYGAGDLRSLPHVKNLGLNTVFIEMGSPVDAGMMSFARVIIQEAEKLDLGVIVGLPTTLPDQYTCSLDNAAYIEGVTEYITTVVRDLREVPGVIGWATSDSLDRDLALSDASFRKYLKAKYGGLLGIEAAWGIELPSEALVTVDAATTIYDELPFGAGQPSIDVADFSARSYHEMMALWARVIREVSEGEGLLVTGRVTLYRSLIAIPDDYDIIVASTPPWLLEPDWTTHNVHSLDIARRGGRRNAMPCLRLPHGLDDGAPFREQRLQEWMMKAAMHGAVGLSFIAPPDVLSDRRVQEQLEDGLAWMADQPAWGTRPRSSAAILYEPYADGFVALETPTYGYIKGMSPREPSDLLNAFKQGTRYGTVDYLSRDDLLDADLDEYGTILAPMALDIPIPLQGRLDEYVSGGGVLVADIGAGCVQSGSWGELPRGLANLFGVGEFTEMRNMTGNLTIHQTHPVLPSLMSGARTTGDFEGSDRGRRTGKGSYSVNSWAGFAELDRSTTPLARLGMSVTEGGKPTFAGVVIRETGRGAAIYATHRLWSAWLPGYGLWDAFHADLFDRRARIALQDAPFMAPLVEVAECEDGSVAFYDPNKGHRVRIALLAADHRLFSGAACQFSPFVIDEAGLRTGGVLATVDTPAHGSWMIRPSSVRIRPFTGIVTAVLESEAADGISLLVGGSGSVPVGDHGEMRPSLGGAQRMRLTVTDGTYRVEPGSKHRVTVANGAGTSAEIVVTAGADGELTTDINVRLAQVTVEPSM